MIENVLRFYHVIGKYLGRNNSLKRFFFLNKGSCHIQYAVNTRAANVVVQMVTQEVIMPVFCR